MNSAEIITGADYTYDIALLINIPSEAKFVLHHQSKQQEALASTWMQNKILYEI